MNEKEIFKKVPVPLTITKYDTIIDVNEETEKFTGYKREELIGKDISILYSSLYEFENIKEKAIKNQGIRGVRSKVKTKEGKIIDVMVHVNLLQHEGGIPGGIGAILDITPITIEEKKLQESIEKLHLLYHSLKILSSSLNIKDVVKNLTEIVRDYFNIDVIGISLLIEENGIKYSEILYFIGYLRESAEKYLKLPIEEWKDKSSLVHAIYTGEIVYIPDTKKAKKNYLEVNKEIRSSLAIPIKFKDEILGGVVFESKEANRFSQEDIDLLGTLADMLSTVIVNARLYEKARELSIKDALTGVYNYRYFYEQIHHEIELYKRYESTFCLAIADLDNFKRINDTYGHIEGDKVLKKIGKTLADNVRKHVDIVCRYGGDEFSIIFPNTQLKDAKKIADRLLQVLSEKGEEIYNVTMSIGLTEYKGEDPIEYISKTDKLAYRAKQKGGNRVEIESPPTPT